MKWFIEVPVCINYETVAECSIQPSAIIMIVPRAIDKCEISLSSGKTFVVNMSEPQLRHKVEHALEQQNS